MRESAIGHGATVTCDVCFGLVLESHRQGHRWWHAGVAELVRGLSRLSDAGETTHRRPGG